jgi:hypothetical protein
MSPGNAPTYSKRQVNRAGRLILAVYDSGYAHVDSDELIDAYSAVTWWRSLHARPLTKVAASLRYHLAEEGAEVEGRIDVAQRLKRRPTMIGKLRRQPKMEITQMHDIGGVRARVPSVQHAYAVSRRLRRTWTVHRARDYIAEPKASGYRAIHLIVRRDGYMIEVQLRTVLQDAWANQVEDDGRRVGVGFKFGQGAAEVHDFYASISDSFAFMDRDQPIPDELARALNEQYPKIRGVLP